ncbi:hypothetical protein DFH07DRAFT_859518, partial [Mycena maculata]
MDSPFTDILYTNSIPSDADCQRICDLLVGPRAEIAQLTDMIDELTKKRAALAEFITAHLALVSPVRRLPADIMQEIFVACLPSGQNSVIAEHDAPLLLCHVCQAWRNLALSTPRLWASLHISVPPMERMPSMNDTVKGWFSLSISVAASYVYDESELGTRMLLDILVCFSRRWEHIRFKVPSYPTLDPMASLSPLDVPILRTVAIEGFDRRTDDNPWDDGTSWNNLNFLGSTSLHSACIPSAGTTLSSIPLRWEALRRLSLRRHFVAADVALTILKQCSLLETCSLMLTERDALSVAECRMDHLQQMYLVDDCGISTASQFFQILITPNLASLEYAGGTYNSSGFPFVSLIASSRSLERLSLQLDGAPSKNLLDALSLVPTVRDLRLLREPTISEEATRYIGDPLFLTALNRVEDGGILCPNLEHIDLRRFHAMSDQILLEFIQARAGPALGAMAPRRLSSVRALIYRERELDIVPQLQALIEDGFAVSLDYVGGPPPYSPSKDLESAERDPWVPFSQSEQW